MRVVRFTDDEHERLVSLLYECDVFDLGEDDDGIIRSAFDRLRNPEEE